MVYDFAVVGSGAAAFAAAISARRLGRSVVMVERGTVGGTCVNVGCVPSKALLAAAEARHVAATARFAGVPTHADGVAMAALTAAKVDLIDGLRAEKYVDLAGDYGWDIVRGQARFAPGPVLEVEQADRGRRRIEADHYLVATGAAPWTPPVNGLAEVGCLTSTAAMELEELPASLLVVGGNYVGLELAQLFARLGVQVTVVEALDRLAPGEEPEVSDALARVLVDEGIDVITAATVHSVRRNARGYRVTAVSGQEERELAAQQLLMATGRRPVTTGLELDAVGVKLGPIGEVVVDEHLRTTNPRISAAGDVTGGQQFVYVAAAQGALVAENAFGPGPMRAVDYLGVPRVAFTDPAIAAVGVTEAEAAQRGWDCETRTLALASVPRAIVNRDTRGLVKIVAERTTGRVLGVHMLAHNAGDVILAAVYAIRAGMTVAQMADTWAPYLTMAESLKLAAQTFTRDVDKLSCCAA